MFPNSKGKEIDHLPRRVKDLGTKKGLTNMTFVEYERAQTTREGREEYRTVRVKNHKTSTTGSAHIT